MKINIRKAIPDDYDAVCAIYEEIDTYHRKHLPNIFQKPDGPARELEYYTALLNDEHVGFYLAEVEGKIIGFGHVVLINSREFPILVPRVYALVDAIAIKDAYQHHGIGKMLMDEMETWAIGSGAASVELNVYEFNQNAISFYEGLGYQTYSCKMSKGL